MTDLLIPKEMLWKALNAYGYDPEPIFRKEGIQREMMKKSDARISGKKTRNLWSKATELIGDPCFGLRAVEYFHPIQFNALSCAWLASVTMRDAFARVHRYVHMLSEATDIQLDENPKGFSVILSDSIEIPARMDLAIAILTKMCRLNLGDDFKPVAVSFTHPRFSCVREYDAFFKAPVTFNAPDNRFTISRNDADRRLVSGSRQLARLNDQYILRYLAKLNRHDLIQQVKVAFLDLIPSGRLTIDRVARRMNMSRRSLQRSLKAEGTTFSLLVDDVRRELAEDYIRDPSFSLTEVAFVLGFSTYTSFSRAYKRWTGMPPRNVRRKSDDIIKSG